MSCGVPIIEEWRREWYDMIWYDHKKPQRNAKQGKGKDREGYVL